jgi:hypothetical protein
MELTKANLLKKFGESVEVCAGSILAHVDGVKHEVATMNPATGEYKLTDVGSKVVYAEAEAAPVEPKKKAKKGLSPEPAPVEPTPIESLDLPGVEPAPAPEAGTLEEALADLDDLDLDGKAGSEADE